MTYRDRDRVVRWFEAGNGEKLTLLDRVILRDIAEGANSETGLAWLGQDTLSTRWGVTTRAVKLSIARLHSHGLLDTVEPGRWHRRARYQLAGEAADTGGTVVHPVEAVQGEPSFPTGGTVVPSQGERSFPTGGTVVHPYPESSRSSYGGMTTPTDAPPRAPDGALRRGQEHASKNRPGTIPADTIAFVAEMLGMRTDEATEWIESKLNGHTVRNIDKYIRTCVENYSPPKQKSAASNNGATGNSPICLQCDKPILAWHQQGFSEHYPYARIGDKPVHLESLWNNDEQEYFHPDCQPTPRTRCAKHYLELPCISCAADRKARAEPEQSSMTPTEAVEKMAQILATKLDLDDDGALVGVDRAGLSFSAWTEGGNTVQVYSAVDDISSEWPEAEPLPDEPLRNRAVSSADPYWGYHPSDAVDLAQAWRDGTDRILSRREVTA